VGVTVEATFGVTVRGLVAGEVPDDEGLVAGSGQEHVGAARGLASCARIALSGMDMDMDMDMGMVNVLLEGSRQGSDPSGVTLKGATEYQLLGHDCNRVAEAVKRVGSHSWEVWAEVDSVLELRRFNAKIVVVRLGPSRQPKRER